MDSITQGKRLKQLRSDRGFSALELSERMAKLGVPVSKAAISNWERGVNGIVLSKLPTLAEALEVSVDELLSEPTDQSADTAIKTKKPNNQSSETLRPTQLPIDQAQSMNTPTAALKKSNKLQNVRYEIRGPLLRAAMRMEEEGHHIIKLNVGNPGPFGFDAPQEILGDVSKNLSSSVGYSDSKGIFSARKAILQYYQARGLVEAVDVEDVFLGNGVSELIVMTMQALLNDGDEVLIPKPDYPLWTAATNLSGGRAVHYRCEESDDWQPSVEDIVAKITPRTRALLVINPNNPTGAVYSKAMLEKLVDIAARHQLILLADEIYDRVLYDDAEHFTLATLARGKNVLVLSFNGLSKSHRIAGFRAGWMLISGKKDHAQDFIEGLEMLSSMRLCSNVPAQHAIQTSIGGYQSITGLTAPGGRLYEQRNLAVDMLNAIPGVSCVMPKGAMYCFPRLDPEVYPIEDDTQFMMDFLKQKKVLMVQGTGFNWDAPDHFRIVFLPAERELKAAISRLGEFLAERRVG